MTAFTTAGVGKTFMKTTDDLVKYKVIQTLQIIVSSTKYSLNITNIHSGEVVAKLNTLEF